jgi:AcrR family transcriptional regulator
VPNPPEASMAKVDQEPRKRTRADDPRSLRSRGLLKDALLKLIVEQPFEKITLRDISTEAGLSYPTIFNQYGSKEALFQDIARAEIIDLLAAFREGLLSPEWRPGKGVCAYVSARRALWRTLLTTGASEAMRSEFIRHGRDLVGDRRALAHGAPFDLVSGLMASGIFEIIAWWLVQDAAHPAEHVADMLETLVIEPGLDLPRGYFTSRARPAENQMGAK